MECAPGNTSKLSCFRYTDLVKLAKAYNKDTSARHFKKINLDKKTSLHKLHDSLEIRLKHICKTESCWLKRPFIKWLSKMDVIYFQNYVFKPVFKGVLKWFDTTIINNILNQYSRLYSHEYFKFFGAVPCDIAVIDTVNFENLKKYQNVGIVFNLDTSKQGGSHWVAVYINNTSGSIDYFDSTGDPPNRHINKFFKLYDETFTVNINKKVHQRGDHHCGVYACYFIIQRLYGKTLKTINKKTITDRQMKMYRKKLLRS